MVIMLVCFFPAGISGVRGIPIALGAINSNKVVMVVKVHM